MFKAVWHRIVGWLGLLGGLIIAALALLQVGRRQGRAQAEQKQTKADMAAVEVGRDAAETIERLDDDAVRDRARARRMRDTEGR
ncbi:Uncharacterised protein [Alcaligenes faecalis]|nr:hypothetical protein CPY64_09605 [Alcaligenes faecalis]AYZ92755.1 hypothetical protein EGY22_15375 [Alcaligenes faecalis]GAU71952.1 hypothetical protein AFA2_00262 [Alcaligenes faecalis subsp. faecalis NBRC 13111]CAJ0905533.1 DUF4169 family protein [Alcaligenes faecalis subsp. faecalis]CUI44228.1 Uncharacterised protein [Alcaligenes faecalis]